VRRWIGAALIVILLFFASSAWVIRAQTKSASAPMKKYVTEQASFVLYAPEGWKASEGVQGQFRTVIASDPTGLYVVALFHGVNPAGSDLLALAGRFVNGIRNQYPDLKLPNVMASRDRRNLVFDGVYTDAQRRKKEFRCWMTGADRNFLYSSIESPEGQLSSSKQLLLTILSNIRIVKGAYQAGTAVTSVPLKPCRLHDGSATFQIPQDWNFQSLGTGSLIARDPSGLFSFIVGKVDVLTPRVNVNVPGAIVSPYLAPHRAMQFVAGRLGLATDMQFLQVIPRQDLNQQLSQGYTAGPAMAEEFLYTFQAQGRRCKGYSFGMSLGSRLNINWSFWHITVGAPAEQFDAYAPTFVSIVQSYKIDDQFAMRYVAQGMARLRQMQQQTAQMVARNRQEISQMMQSAYDERQKSMDYIDYQRSNYIRGHSDWVSNMEGGTVYHSDRWGTKNTTTGEYYEGQAYNYFNFTGKNPKYTEQMTAIDSRALYEANIKGK
jgi:hypothetical protein